MRRVYTANAILDSDLKIPLAGAAIGNGWIDVRRQYPAYLDYSVKHGLIEPNSEVRCPGIFDTHTENLDRHGKLPRR